MVAAATGWRPGMTVNNTMLQNEEGAPCFGWRETTSFSQTMAATTTSDVGGTATKVQGADSEKRRKEKQALAAPRATELN